MDIFIEKPVNVQKEFYNWFFLAFVSCEANQKSNFKPLVHVLNHENIENDEYERWSSSSV